MRTKRSFSVILLVLTLLLAALGQSSAEEWELFKDLQPTQGSHSTPFTNYPVDGFSELNGYLYVSANRADVGTELFRTDGTPGNMALVADIATGKDVYGRPNSSSPSKGIVFAGELYFRAGHPETGVELYKTDGTNTVLVKDIYPGSFNGHVNGGSPLLLGVMGDRLYFQANDGIHGFEIWGTDGTAAGTVMVKDLTPELDAYGRPISSYAEEFTLLGDKLVFTMRSPTLGRELFVSDGTEAGTKLLKDIYPGSYEWYGTTRPNDSGAWGLTRIGDRVYFTANDGTHGAELWVTDGTLGGTHLYADVDPRVVNGTPYSGYPRGFVEMNGVLYFTASREGGSELWRSEGSPETTRQVKDIYPGTYESYGAIYPNSSQPLELTRIGNLLVFSADDGIYGREPWVTDGTAGGTMLLRDIAPGLDPATTQPIPSTPEELIVLGNQVIFRASSADEGTELWITDGTPGGTLLVTDLNPGPGDSAPRLLTPGPQGKIFFRAEDGTHGDELFRTDGTAAGTELVFDINPTGGSDSEPRNLTVAGSRIFFITRGVSLGEEREWLWVSDGTPENTVQIRDIGPLKGSNQGSRYSVIGLGDKVLFTCDDGIHGPEPWVSGGTPETTFLLHDFGNVWSSYGTVDGSTITDLNSVILGDKVLFRAKDSDHGTELWVTDGTPEGTTILKDILPGVDAYGRPLSSWPDDFAVSNGLVYFRAQDADHGAELWKTDGTEAGTVLLKDIYPGNSSSYPSEITAFGNHFLFSAADGDYGGELWISDGTAGGTVLLKDIYPGMSPYGAPNGSGPLRIYDLGDGTAVFLANDGIHGYEIWVTDGTPAGTHLVKDAVPGGDGLTGSPGWWGSEYPGLVIDGTLYTALGETFHGVELWKTDGTAAGTGLVKDLWPGNLILYSTNYGPNSSYPERFTEAFGFLYFTTYSAHLGTNLWRSDGTEEGTQPVLDPDQGPDKLRFVNVDLSQPVLFEDRLFVSADDLDHGSELWIVSPTPVLSVDRFDPGEVVDWAALKPMEFLVRGASAGAGTLTMTGYLDGAPIPATGPGITMTTPTGSSPQSTLKWTPGPSDAGTHVVKFVLTDGTKTVEYSFTVEIRFDSDGDGLPDLWEEEGYTHGGVFVDLPNLTGLILTEGARSDRPDIFVEIDWMEDATHSHRPFNQGLAWVIDAFAAQGIALHIVVDEPVPHYDDLGTNPQSYDWEEFDNLKDRYFTLAHRPAFRYCLYAHSLGGTTTSGISRNVPGGLTFGASDSIAALGAWTEGTGTQEEQAGTFMHELGHNLGLRHGGADDISYKPNYLSVMNYFFQMSGVLGPRPMNYSSFALPDLDELTLVEADGLPGGSGYAAYGTRWWYPTKDTGNLKEVASIGAEIDWNDDGDTLDTFFKQDVNGDGQPLQFTPPGYVYVPLSGYDDWSNLRFTGGLVGGTGVGLPDVTEAEELTLEEARQVVPAPPANENPPVAVAVLISVDPSPDDDGTVVVTVDGTGSCDLDGDDLTYWWYAGETFLGHGEFLTANFGTGNHLVSLVVEDRSLTSLPSEVSFQVAEGDLVVSVDPARLWPANHQLVDVRITASKSDVLCRVTKVTSNEEIDGPGDGSTEPDWLLTGDVSVVQLRAERAGKGQSRIYTVHYATTDGAGRVTFGSVEVVVPHDQRKNSSTGNESEENVKAAKGSSGGSTAQAEEPAAPTDPPATTPATATAGAEPTTDVSGSTSSGTGVDTDTSGATTASKDGTSSSTGAASSDASSSSAGSTSSGPTEEIEGTVGDQAGVTNGGTEAAGTDTPGDGPQGTISGELPK